MSHHIVHILNHGSRLAKERGMMVCRHEENETVNEIPIEDVRALIIAAHGISLSQELVSALMETNAVILHCDHSYKPVGITSGMGRVVNSEALANQANQGLKLHDRLWKLVVCAKAANQLSVLELFGENSAFIRRQVESGNADEAACARHYWPKYFALAGAFGASRHDDDPKGCNARLDYGYAVLGALIHRSTVAHGLSPVFGMRHAMRYKAHALVYDLIEPWRPYVDRMLLDFFIERSAGSDFRDWARHVAGELSGVRLETPGQILKLLDAIDVYVSRIVRCYAEKTITHAWMPVL